VTTLLVGNLPYAVQEADLRSLFDRFGVGSVRVIEGKGIAFVDVELPAEAIAATWDAKLKNRTIRVKLAHPG